MEVYAQEEQDFRSKFNEQLEIFLNNYKNSYKEIPEIKEAMLHSALVGTPKRIRPLLVYAVAKSVTQSPPQSPPSFNAADFEKIIPAAIAVETIHCYSLIHDDLPAMDDDDLRRGMPSCHIKFGEATAILTGNIMQVIAFDSIMGDTQYSSAKKEEIISLLIKTSCDIVYGQTLDLRGVNKRLSLDEIKLMHQLKCGALIRTAMQLGVLIQPNPLPEVVESIKSAGDKIGLAFQIRDDIIDMREEGEGSDGNYKSTYPSIAGIDESFKELKKLYEGALADLHSISGNVLFLNYLFGIMTDILPEEMPHKDH